MASEEYKKNKMICALSGQECTDPVVTPSGYVCERRLLLSKMVDTGGNDPFQQGVMLNESDLISMNLPKASSYVSVPRLETATSFTNLMQLMQREHDALLLELYDTRKTLEETRMELVQALYQNDAAVRVIARVTMERDQARQDLMHYNPSQHQQTQQGPSLVRDEPVAPDSSGENMEVEQIEAGVEPAPKADNVIPDEDMKVLTDTWDQLCSQRKARKKQKDVPVVPPDEISKLTMLESRSLHKSNKPGVMDVATVGDYVASAGKDKSVIVYSHQRDKILHNLSSPASSPALSAIDIVEIPFTVNMSPSLQLLVVAGDVSGSIRCYAEFMDAEEKTSIMRSFGDVKGGLGLDEDNHAVVSVSFHPSGKYVLATTTNGHITMVKIVQPSESVADGTLEILTKHIAIDQLQTEKGIQVTSAALHPDGLIYVIGLSDGSLRVWDLTKQSMVSTFSEHKGSVTSISFNYNGYHLASASDAGEVIVWDLKKGKVVTILNAQGEEKSIVGGIDSVEFDSTGKYLAYASIEAVHVVMMKEWDNVLLSIEDTGFSSKKGKSSEHRVKLKWSGSSELANSTSFVLGASNDRALRFFGTSANVKTAANVKPE